MPLVTSKEMFEKTYKGKCIVGTFNVNSRCVLRMNGGQQN